MTHPDHARHARFACSPHRPAKRLHDPTLSNRAFAIFFVITVLIAISLLLAPKARAATIVKANNTNNLNTTTSWTGATVPGSGDIAKWDSTVTGANTVLLGANLTFGEIQIANPGGAVTINAGNTLTLAGISGVGIDMSSATQNLTLNCTIAVNGTQSWNVASGRTLTIGGTVNMGGTLTLTIGSLSGSGTFTNTGSNNTTSTLKVGSNNDSTTFSGQINDGSGARVVALTKEGTGTLTLTGTNSYSGTTTISSGTLQIGNGGTTGTLGSGSVVDNATLAFNRSDTITVGNSISGTGALNQIGSGTTILTGANNYSGTTTISAGTLQIGNGGTTGTLGTGAVTDNATLAFNRSNSLTVSNDISGTGVLNQIGAGTLTLSGNNSYTGGTNINAGTLSLGSANAIGTSGTISFGGGILQYSASNTTDYSARFSNAAGQQYKIDTNGQNVTFGAALTSSGGTFTKLGTGTLQFSGTTANTYTGLTTVNGGELDLNKTAGINAIAGNLTIGDGSGTDTVKLLAANQIADTSAVQIDGTSGVLSLNGNNETIASLADRTGGTGTSGSVQLGTGTLSISPSSGSTTFSGVISGGGNLVKTGNGTQVLGGNSTYTGTTTISGGTLEINNTGMTGKLGGTSGITLNSGGTLLLSGSNGVTDRINNSATFTLNGGTFNTGGRSEGAPGTNGIGALTLTATSTIDFGSSNTSVIQFAGLGTHTSGQILQLINWNGNPDAGGTGDRLLFAGLSSAFTSQYSQSDVVFNNGMAGYNIYQFTGFYEVTAVPEPGTWFGAGLALLAVLYSQRGRLLRLKRVEVRKD